MELQFPTPLRVVLLWFATQSLQYPLLLVSSLGTKQILWSPCKQQAEIYRSQIGNQMFPLKGIAFPRSVFFSFRSNAKKLSTCLMGPYRTLCFAHWAGTGLLAFGSWQGTACSNRLELTVANVGTIGYNCKELPVPRGWNNWFPTSEPWATLAKFGKGSLSRLRRGEICAGCCERFWVLRSVLCRVLYRAVFSFRRLQPSAPTCKNCRFFNLWFQCWEA